MGRICRKQQEQNLIFDKKVTSCRYGMYVKAAFIQTYQDFVGIVGNKKQDRSLPQSIYGVFLAEIS